MRKEPFIQPTPLAAATFGVTQPPNRGVISDGTAAAIHGFPLISGQPTPPFLTLPRGCHARRHPAWKVHIADIDPADLIETAEGYPVTGLRRTAIDCARTMPLYDAVAILDWVLNRELVSVEELKGAAAAARGRGAGALQRAVRLSDRRAESAQESVARIALRAVGVVSQPQYPLLDGPFEHHFDLGMKWAKTVIDLQSKAHHSLWSEVQKDISHLQLVNVTAGWKLAFTVPAMVLPTPTKFVQAVMNIIVRQPGPQCRALEKRYVDADGDLMWHELATKEAEFLK